MQFLIIKAVPDPSSTALQSYGGAMVACWIASDAPSDAVVKASSVVTQSGWRVVECVENRASFRDDYCEGAPELEYYDQAVTDGEVCVFYTYPVGKI